MDTALPTINPEVARLRHQAAQRKLRKQRRLVRLLWTIAGVLLILLLIEVPFAVSFSPRFWIYRITVLPTETITYAEVIHLLALPPRSNYNRVSLTKLAERLRRDPRVASAQVKHGPVGTLIVQVHERQAVSQVICHGVATEPALYMDREGYLFSRPVPPSHPVPVVDGLELPPLTKVLGLQMTDTSSRAVLQLLPQFGKIGDVVLHIDQVSVDRGLLNMRLHQGTLVHVGIINGIDMHQQAQCMDIALTAIRQHGYTLDQIAEINISHVVREKGKGILYTPRKVPGVTTQP